MPTYQYRCSDCGRDLEVVQKFTDAALTDCPTCSGRLRKVYNAVGVVFKGSGFYSTDSRSSANGSKPASSGSEASSTSGDGSSSTDSATGSNGSSKDSSNSSSNGSSAGSSAPAKAAAG